MNKLNLVLAGAALACATQFAAAQGTPMAAPSTASDMHANDPAYVDQSRLPLRKDPYIKKRITSKDAREEYRAKKHAAKKEYKEEKAEAKAERRATNKEAVQERKEELKEMRK